MNLPILQNSHLNFTIWIFKLVLNFLCIWSCRCFINLKCIKTLFLNLHCKVASFTFRVFIRLINIRGVIIHFCNNDLIKLLPIIFVWHKEYSIVFIKIKAYSRLFSRINLSPNRIMIRPFPMKFTLSPWITELNKSVFLTIKIQ